MWPRTSPETLRYGIHAIRDLVSELHDIAGNPPHHQNLGKTSDASLTRIDSPRQLSSPAFAINLGSHYDNSPITTVHTAPWHTSTGHRKFRSPPPPQDTGRLPASSCSSFNFSHSTSSSSSYSSFHINVIHSLFLFVLYFLNFLFQYSSSCAILLAQTMGFSRKRHQCWIPHKSTSPSEA